MHKQYNRLFIGLDLSAEDKLALEDWRCKFLRGIAGNPVPMENFHLTLSFLGQVSPSQFETLDQALGQVKGKAFQLKPESLGYFSKPKVLFLKTSLPEPLEQLASDCSKINKLLGLRLAHDTYRPHISLFRKHPAGTPIDVPLPELDLKFGEFHLFQSISSTKPGHPPHYPKLSSFDLIPNFNRV